MPLKSYSSYFKIQQCCLHFCLEAVRVGNKLSKYNWFAKLSSSSIIAQKTLSEGCYCLNALFCLIIYFEIFDYAKHSHWMEKIRFQSIPPLHFTQHTLHTGRLIPFFFRLFAKHDPALAMGFITLQWQQKQHGSLHLAVRHMMFSFLDSNYCSKNLFPISPQNRDHKKMVQI